MNKQLPERPDFGQLKKQARELLDDVHAGKIEALSRIADERIARDDFALHDAQRVLAREFGFASWAKLKLHVETRQIDAAEARLIEAVLEGEREVVDVILAERPQLGRRNVWTAAVLGDPATVKTAITQAPALASARGGPREWELLLYVSFGQCGMGDDERAEAALALLDEGANANASWLHCDWPESPLPALYGATGVNNYPRLARVLLERGANPNDGESRYHAAEHAHIACLEVLAEFGTDFSSAAGLWGTTPLSFLFGWANPTPAVRAGLQWLLEHGANPNVRSLPTTLDQTALHAAVAHGWDVAVVEMLLKHGADPTLTRADGRTAYALAVRSGREDVAEALRARAAVEELARRDEFLGCIMRVDAEGVRKVIAAEPGLMATLSPEDLRLPLLAAKRGWAEALELFGECGFDLTVAGEWGEQPLHWAAWHGWAAAVRVLIARGVALSACDQRFEAPPTGWCAHGSEACANPKGEYASVLEMLIAAGAFVAEGTSGSREVMAVLKRVGVGGRIKP